MSESKITNFSFKVSDEKTVKAIEAIIDKELNFSKTVRRLIREFVDDGCKFKNERSAI